MSLATLRPMRFQLERTRVIDDNKTEMGLTGNSPVNSFRLNVKFIIKLGAFQRIERTMERMPAASSQRSANAQHPKSFLETMVFCKIGYGLVKFERKLRCYVPEYR